MMSVDVPDGGYGWVIVICSFMCAFVIDGLVGSFGLVYPDLLHSLHSSPSVTSMVGSTLIGSFLLMGILTSKLILRFGCRPVAMTGALVSSLGFCLSFFATNVWILLATYGIIAGIGIGLVYLPAAVIVCSYFSRKLGIAQGIVFSGSGVGIMCIALLIEFSLESYGWRGTMLISAGLMVQLCVAIILMKSANPERRNFMNSTVAIDEAVRDHTTLSHGKSASHASITNTLASINLPLEVSTSYHSLFSIPSLSPNSIHNSNQLHVSEYEIQRSHTNICSSPLSQKSLSNISRHSQYSVLTTEQQHTDNCDCQFVQLDTESECSNNTESPSKLWTNTSFILLGAGAVLTQMAQNIPTVYLAEYGHSIGVERSQISFVIAVFGIVNTIGRLLAGLLAYSKIVTPLTICNIGLGVCAGGCLAFPLCTEFWSLMLFAVTFGFFIGHCL